MKLIDLTTEQKLTYVGLLTEVQKDEIMIGYGNSMFLATHGILARANAGTPPINTVAPVISGGTSLGSVLTSTTGTWTGTPTIAYTYQWKRGVSNIIGATSSTYTLVVADSGAAITCVVTATNPFGTANATSNVITAQTYTAPVNTVAPAITGTAQEGQIVTCSTGTWTGTPTIAYTYQWRRGVSGIIGATSSTYLLVSADVGQSIKCVVTATNGAGSANADSNTVTPTAAVDPDAQAFITAAAITNPTQQAAINTLVVDLKGYSIWSKMKALYPFVGGSASSHKFNLKDPRDLNAAFRLVFSGGWTHNSNGITGNGVNTEANTKLVNNAHLTATNGSFGFYLRNTQSANVYDFSPGGFFGIALYIDTRYYMYGDLTSIAGLPSPAFYGLSRIGGTHKGYRNGVVNLTSTSAATLNAGEFSFKTNLRNYAFGYIADGLTDAENTNLYTAVQAFQTTLNRNV